MGVGGIVLGGIVLGGIVLVGKRSNQRKYLKKVIMYFYSDKLSWLCAMLSAFINPTTFPWKADFLVDHSILKLTMPKHKCKSTPKLKTKIFHALLEQERNENPSICTE